MGTLATRYDAAVAAFAGLASVAMSYAVAGLTPAFVAAPVEAVIRDVSPAVLVAVAIDELGALGHQLLLVAAIGATAVLVGALVALTLALTRTLGVSSLAPLLAGAGTATLAGILGSGTLGALAVGAASGFVVGVGVVDGDIERRPSLARRAVLRVGVAAAGVSSLGAMARFFGGDAAPPTRDLNLSTATVEAGDSAPVAETAETEADRVAEMRAMAVERSLDVAGIPGLLTPESAFYEVDYSNVDPTVLRDDWTLTLRGDDLERTVLDFERLRAYPTEHRFVTLRCVGDPLNGRKMDTALWTGTPVSALLDDVSPSSDCGCVFVRAADGYYQEFPLAALRESFLAYGMNGESLPRGHGYPVRLLVPGHWGEINVKWLTEIEFLDEEATGYWEKRGWHGTGPVNTVAKLHAVNRLDGGRVQVAGHAYAGTRGVSAVEVSTDGGATWSDATLSARLPGDDVWRQWAYTFEATGTHEVVVRAVEDDGTVQPRTRRDSYPSGATGWVSRRVRR